MNTKLLTLSVLLLAPAFLSAEEPRFVSKVKLPSGQTAVVAEGDYEARSLGSFSVRVYDAAEEQDATTFFASGLVVSRDGTVEKVSLGDIDNDKAPEVIVSVRSAGSGSYLSAHAFKVKEKSVVLARSVEGLPANAEVLAELTKVR